MAQAPVELGPEDGAGAGRPLGRPPISFTQARWERMVDRWDAEVAPVVDALAELDEAMEDLGAPQARRDAVKRAVTEALAAACKLKPLLKWRLMPPRRYRQASMHACMHVTTHGDVAY